MNEFIRKDSNKPMHYQHDEMVPYLCFPALLALDGVVHGFSTRKGGVSEGCLSELNLSFARGDEPENVRENFKRISKSIGFSTEDLVFSVQTHTTNVRRVGRDDRGCGFLYPTGYDDVDGLITNEENVVLTTFFADCVPLYMVDPVKRASGLSHAGGKGTVGKIGRKTFEAMTKE